MKKCRGQTLGGLAYFQAGSDEFHKARNWTMPKTTARDLIRHDIEIQDKISNLRRHQYNDVQFTARHPDLQPYTHQWYDTYHKAHDEHLAKVKPQIEALEADPGYLTFDKILDHIRTLPRDEARFLLNACAYKWDGDYVYGSWPDPDKDPAEWY